MSSNHSVGERLSYDGALCTVRYVGEVTGTKGSWLGVEWDDPTRGKHDGQHKGVRYFHCKIPSPTAASFVRPTRPVQERLDFLSALSEKYASEVTKEQVPIAPEKQVVISGKVAEEVGFDKIRRKLAQLNELKIVILDGMRVSSAYALASTSDQDSGRRRIKDACPKVTELDLSRNLFSRFGTVVEICSELSALNNLKINGNRFDETQDDELMGAEKAFGGVKELAMGETLLTWEDICRISSRFAALNSLQAGTNRLSLLSPIPSPGFASTLTSLNLEFNDFTSFSDIEPLTSLTSLRNLTLKGNSITSIVSTSPPDIQAPIFTTNLHYLDLSYNQVSTWSFVNALPASFPGLTSLRFSHNPIYDNPALDTLSSPEAAPTALPHPQAGKAAPPSDEAYMLTLGRLPNLRVLNFSTVTTADRTNADMFYLSRIARQLAAAPASDAEAVLAHHRRWAELCEEYGEPDIVRRSEVNPNFLEARLVNTQFYLAGAKRPGPEPTEKTAEIPKSFDIYAVKGIVGRLFGLSPLAVQLVWETGEWDPVGGFDEEDEDSSDEAEGEVKNEGEAKEETGKNADAHAEEGSQSGRKAGRWVKREVELKEGPRQFGYCVEGLEARIRVEMR